jgi:hypothetical protein
VLYYDYDGDDEEKIAASEEYYYDETPPSRTSPLSPTTITTGP